MQTQKLIYHTRIDKPLDEVFAFFSRAENLNLLVPSHLQFQILTPTPIPMQKGQIILYRIKLFGIPFKWKTEICEWNPPHLFADQQLSGPYTIWVHEHSFREENGKTLMTDTIHYQSKGWIFAPIMHWLFVDQNVKGIFAYREKKLNEIFKPSSFSKEM